MTFAIDRLILRPDDIDLARSPLRPGLDAPTRVLGAFNPGLTRLPGGNLLMMARIAEAPADPGPPGALRTLRWAGEGSYALDDHAVEDAADAADPRVFALPGGGFNTLALTSLSWLLPVELSPDGLRIVDIHYGSAIAPRAAYQEYGVEDARISRVGDTWHMTACSVSAQRQGTSLYTSTDGLNYRLEGLILDHQNKDMLIFEGKVDGRFAALTRPLGDAYLTYPPDSPFASGPAIHLAWSPDALHWKPHERPCIRPLKDRPLARRIGGGSPPVLTEAGWLTLFHGVQMRGAVGVYRTFWALLDTDDPSTVIYRSDAAALLEADRALTRPLHSQMYLDDIVFTTGMVDAGDTYIVASGEADLACRMTHVPKAAFQIDPRR